jgi:hypothetical protein
LCAFSQGFIHAFVFDKLLFSGFECYLHEKFARFEDFWRKGGRDYRTYPDLGTYWASYLAAGLPRASSGVAGKLTFGKLTFRTRGASPPSLNAWVRRDLYFPISCCET